jgi:hypothetical protein
LLWCYAVMVTPWVLFERHGLPGTGAAVASHSPSSRLLFFQLACAVALILIHLALPGRLVVTSFVTIMAISLLLDCAEFTYPASDGLQIGEEGAKTRRKRLAAAGLMVAIALVFAIDVATPAGIDDGAGYGPLLIICLWLPGRRTLLVTACVMTALVVAGFFLVQPGEIGIAGTLLNRALSLASIWILYLLLSRRSLLLMAIAAAERRLRMWR